MPVVVLFLFVVALGSYFLGSAFLLGNAGGNPSAFVRGGIIGTTAIAAGIGALSAGGVPSGSASADAAYKFLLGGGMVVAACVAGRKELVGGAFAVVAVMAVELLQTTTPGIVAIGVSAGLCFSRLRPAVRSSSKSPAALGDVIVAALSGAFLANALLRLPTSLPSRIPSIVAAGVAGLVVVSAWARSNRRSRRLVTVIAGTLGVAATSVAGVAAIQIFGVRAAAEDGISQTRTALAAARRGDVEAAESGFLQGANSLAKARSVIDGAAPSMAKYFPIVGNNVVVLRSLTSAAEEVTSIAGAAVGALDLADLRLNDGRIAVDRIEELQAPLAAAQASLAKAQVATEGANGLWIAPELVTRSRSLSTELLDAQRSVDEATVVVEALPGLLGSGEPRRYLLIVQTPTEARGSGGLIGSFGEITAVDGKISLERFGRTIELNENGTPGPDRTLIAPPDYLRRYARFEVSQLWQNVTLSPDFPSAAAAMKSLYPQSGGTEIDGVISVDPYALASILSITGPVAVDGWPEPLTAATAPRTLFFDFYAQLAEERNDERIDLQGQLARQAWTLLLRGPVPSVRELSSAMSGAARGRHLQMWAARSDEQLLMRQVGIDGGFGAPPGDSFAVISNNAGANKIDWYLHRTISYQSTVDFSTGLTTARAVVALRNDAPPRGAARYLIGNKADPPAPDGTSVQYLSLYSPLELKSAIVDGKTVEFERDTELGRNVYSAWIRIDPQTTMEIVAELSGTVDLGGSGMDRQYQLQLGCQAMVNNDQATVSIRVLNPPGAFSLGGELVGPSAAGPFTNQGDLDCRKVYSVQAD
jgi:Protein of unknown function (DUF4012)